MPGGPNGVLIYMCLMTGMDTNIEQRDRERLTWSGFVAWDRKA